MFQGCLKLKGVKRDFWTVLRDSRESIWVNGAWVLTAHLHVFIVDCSTATAHPSWVWFTHWIALRATPDRNFLRALRRNICLSSSWPTILKFDFITYIKKFWKFFFQKSFKCNAKIFADDLYTKILIIFNIQFLNYFNFFWNFILEFLDYESSSDYSISRWICSSCIINRVKGCIWVHV